MTETTTLQGAFPIVPYKEPRAAIDWLARAFGAEPTAVYPPEPDQPLVHAEVRVGTGIVMLSDVDRAGESPFAMAGPVVLTQCTICGLAATARSKRRTSSSLCSFRFASTTTLRFRPSLSRFTSAV